MVDPNVGELAARVARLERSMVRWRWATLLGVGLATALGAGQAGGTVKELRAERVAIVDGEGRVRIDLKCFEDLLGQPGIGINDPRDERQVLLGGGQFGGCLLFNDTRRDDSEKTFDDAVMLGPRFVMSDSRKVVRVAIGLREGGRLNLGYNRADGLPAWRPQKEAPAK